RCGLRRGGADREVILPRVDDVHAPRCAHVSDPLGLLGQAHRTAGTVALEPDTPVSERGAVADQSPVYAAEPAGNAVIGGREVEVHAVKDRIGGVNLDTATARNRPTLHGQ